MSKFAVRLLTLAIFAVALVTAPIVSTVYAAPDKSAAASILGQEEKVQRSQTRHRGHGIRQELSRGLRHDL